MGRGPGKKTGFVQAKDEFEPKFALIVRMNVSHNKLTALSCPAWQPTTPRVYTFPERVQLHMLMQVLPGHPLAHPRKHINQKAAAMKNWRNTMWHFRLR